MNTFSQPPVFAYLETTIPVGMTIPEYRAARPPKPSRLARAGAYLSRPVGQRAPQLRARSVG
jgi:hypothetical protein